MGDRNGRGQARGRAKVPEYVHNPGEGNTPPAHVPQGVWGLPRANNPVPAAQQAARAAAMSNHPPLLVQPQGVWARPPGPQPQGVWGNRQNSTVAQPPQQQQQQQQQQQEQQQPQGAIRKPGPPGFVQTPQPGPAGDSLNGAMQGLRIGNGGNGHPGDGDIAVGSGYSSKTREWLREDPVLRTRPDAVAASKKGTEGRKVMLTSNYFKVTTRTDWCLYQYRVDFAPDVERTSVRMGLLRNHKKILGGYIFEGTVLYTSHKLHPEPMELYSLRDVANEKIRISIRLVGDVDPADGLCIQIINHLIRMSLGHLDLKLVGRDFHDPAQKVSMPQYRVELWPGYRATAHQLENEVFMCAQVFSKVMHTNNLLNVFHECIQKFPAAYKTEFEKRVLGTVVLTDYSRNQMTYKIAEVDFKQTPLNTFKKSSGEEVTYLSYYKSKYAINVSPNQPLLITKSTPRARRSGANEYIYLVPELCQVTGITDDMRSNFSVMRAIADHTRLSPAARVDKMMRFRRRLDEPKEIVELHKQWNLSLAPNPVQFEGRILPQEKVAFGSKTREDNWENAEWSSVFSSRCTMLSNAKLDKWTIIAQDRMMQAIQPFVQKLLNASSGLGFAVTQPRQVQLRDTRTGSYVQALEEELSEWTPQLIMCVIPNMGDATYAAIKKKCCVDRPVLTQVMKLRTVEKSTNLSIPTKVAIQMNCKLGGVPWGIGVPPKRVMVAGFDVCRDTTNKSKSYGALVCSLNDTWTRYFSAVSSHVHGEELCNEIAANFIKALFKYKECNNGQLPDRILMFRDGVGDGDIPAVLSHEVDSLKESLARVYNGHNYKLAYIIVTKRIDTRLFFNKRGPGGPAENPLPGTVVDDTITNPEKYDFFLVSQSVRQGTVSPTCYNIISDNSGFSPNHMQRIAYKLTHLYFNWPGTVRVPAPTQYAHKLAFLVAQSVHRQPSTQLEDSLYFL